MGSQIPNIEELYHGTSRTSAREIITHGFQLPDKAGMFGTGIYFACNPLKSWQYSVGKDPPGQRHYMLVCDVALGRPMELKEALPQINIPCGSEFDSVVGLTRSEGGALRVREYVVYKPTQV